MAAKVETPHFDLPFTFKKGEAIVVEQDSEEDVFNCVEAILRTPKEFREELPSFGITEPEFSTPNVDESRMISEVIEWEPRAELIITHDNPAILSDMIDRLKIEVGGPHA